MIVDILNRYGTARSLIVVLCCCAVLSALDPARSVLGRLENATSPHTSNFVFSDDILGFSAAVHRAEDSKTDRVALARGLSTEDRVWSIPSKSIAPPVPNVQEYRGNRDIQYLIRNRFDGGNRRAYLPGIVLRGTSANSSRTTLGARLVRTASAAQSKINPIRMGQKSRPAGSLPLPQDVSSDSATSVATPAVVPTPSGSSQGESKFLFRSMGGGQVDVYEKVESGSETYLATQLQDTKDPAIVFQGKNGESVWQRVFEALFARIENLDGKQEVTSAGLLLKSLSRNSDLRIVGIEEGDTLVSLNGSPFPMPGTDALFSGLASDYAYLEIFRAGEVRELLLYRYEE